MKQLITENEIEKIVNKVAIKIRNDYKDKNLLYIGILNGAFIFLSDLVRKVDLPGRIEFMKVSSYNDSKNSSHEIKIEHDLSAPITSTDVLIVEDILDTGNTLYTLKKILLTRNPNSIKICTLLDKPSRRTANINADYVGKEIPDEFVIGYGLDYAGYGRCFPYIGVTDEEVENIVLQRKKS